MPCEPISRRTFLAASAGIATAAGAASILGTSGIAAAGRNTALSPLVLSTDLYASPDPQRLAFGIARGPRFAAGPPARVAVIPPGSTENARVAAVETTLHDEGLPKGRGVYVTDVTLPEAGNYDAFVITRGKQVPFAVRVNERAQAPTVGSAAPRDASPTLDERMGVKPICTRKPRCPLHDVSLADVIGSTPVAVMFATPALCVSQYCGPVLDQLLELREQYAGRITFVHVEIYKSTSGVKRSPTVAAWNLPSEPWLYTIDSTGTIRGRIDGAFGSDEIQQQLDGVLA